MEALRLLANLEFGSRRHDGRCVMTLEFEASYRLSDEGNKGKSDLARCMQGLEGSLSVWDSCTAPVSRQGGRGRCRVGRRVFH